jgi:hypothetical protein
MQKTIASSVLKNLRAFLTLLVVVGSLVSVARAQVVLAPATPQVGSSNPVSAEPPVSHPDTRPCVVPLMTNAAFENYNGTPLSYAPPASCPGPWAKVILKADFTVTAGVQYDRSAWFYLGDVNIFYGTTAEPGSTLSPSWQIERDVTDLSALLKSPQTGLASIGNTVNSTYTGIIYASAELDFYPATRFDPPPAVPDLVEPVSSGNGPGTLNTGADQVTETLTLPRNVEKVYLDVIAQSQIGDEFWYLCVPNDVTTELESCGNTAFRETEISIDGKAAGVAPVYPWIFTGGIDPYLWIPITGVQTLNFKPYRVDLTPFAGVLGDGSEHTVAISVYNANGYFLATGNLLVYTDHGSDVVGGEVTSNTLSAEPSPVVTEAVSTTNGVTTGTVSVGSNRSFSITGYVNTSHGRVETTVAQRVDFLSTQTFNVNGNTGYDLQNAVQSNTVDSTTTTRSGIKVETLTKHISYPFTLDYTYAPNANGSASQVATSDQQWVVNDALSLNGFPQYQSDAQEQVKSTDTLQITAAGTLAAPGVGHSSASYSSQNSLGQCYSESLTAANQVLTSVKNGQGCHRWPF